jgi:hypothetical protein
MPTVRVFLPHRHLSSRMLSAVPLLLMAPTRRRHRSIPRIPKSRRFDVSRDEFNRVIDVLNKRGEILQASLDQMRGDLDVQFKRIAQLQIELDRVKKGA